MKILNLILLAGFAFTSYSSLFGQNIVPSIEWESVGRASACEFSSVVQTEDGGHIFGGRTYDLAEPSVQNDSVLVKVDSQGELQWRKVYGGSGNEILRSLLQTRDGGFIFAASSDSPPSGTKESPGFGKDDAWIVKVGTDGSKQWERSFGGTMYDHPGSILQTLDGGYVFAGQSGAAGWVVKIQSNGDKEWERTFEPANNESFSAIKQLADEGYLVIGSTSSPSSGTNLPQYFGGLDALLIRLDVDGNKEWERSFGGSGDDAFLDFDQLDNGTFILAGTSSSPSSGNKTSALFGGTDYWLVNVDANGEKKWEKSFGTSASNEEVRVVRQASDGGFVLGANNLSQGLAQIIKADSQGQVIWRETFGNNVATNAYRNLIEIKDLESTKDGGYILCGHSEDPNAGTPGAGCYQDAWSVKLKSVLSNSGNYVTWNSNPDVILESAGLLNGDWKNDPGEILFIGEAKAFQLLFTNERQFYRLHATTSTNNAPNLTIGTVLKWAAGQNDLLEYSPSQEGNWATYLGDQGTVGNTEYAIIPQNLQKHYFRTRHLTP